MSWEQDSRGYPERTFPIKVLPVDSSSISFRGEGREPYQLVQLQIDETSPAGRSLATASAALRNSHLVAFPTETVYGLGGNALDPDAALKIFRAKGRPVDNPLIVHISDMHMLRQLLPDNYRPGPVYTALMESFWPGAMTLLFPADEAKVPSVVRCGLKTVGVRMPSHPVAIALIAASGLPLAAPSANASGRPSPTTAMHVYRDMTTGTGQELEGRIPYIIDGGACHVGIESTVLDGVTDQRELRVLRPGGVGVEDIERVLQGNNLLEGANGSSSSAVKVRVYGKDLKKDTKEEEQPSTPGMKYRHYSPDADVVLLVGEKEGSRREGKAPLPLRSAINRYTSQHPRAGQGRLQIGLMSMDDSDLTLTLFPQECGIGGHSNGHSHDIRHFSLGSVQTPAIAAQRLFEGLRALDEGDQRSGQKRCDIIFVEALSDDAGVGLAIINRLQKAAGSVINVRY